MLAEKWGPSFATHIVDVEVDVETGKVDVLRYTATGQIELTIPIVLFTVIFGLSMDYELFLLSRIREEYDRTGDTVQSVALVSVTLCVFSNRFFLSMGATSTAAA